MNEVESHSPMPKKFKLTLIAVALFLGAGATAFWVDTPLQQKTPKTESTKTSNNNSKDASVSAPHFSFPTLGGKTVGLDDYQGKYLLVNFWATWCGPCKVEMPSLESLHEKFKDRDLTVVAVSNDVFGEKVVKPYIEAQNLTFTIGLDPKLEVSNQFGVVSLPTTFLIDPQGKIIGVLNGAENWMDPQTLVYFDQLLEPALVTAEVKSSSECQDNQTKPC